MQRIINRKLYNTETAECVGSYSNMYDTGNFHYYNEKLYRKKNGEWFLYGEGHGLSKYAEVCGRERRWGEAIIPYTEDEARDWIAEYCSVDTYIEYFGMPEE